MLLLLLKMYLREILEVGEVRPFCANTSIFFKFLKTLSKATKLRHRLTNLHFHHTPNTFTIQKCLFLLDLITKIVEMKFHLLKIALKQETDRLRCPNNQVPFLLKDALQRYPVSFQSQRIIIATNIKKYLQLKWKNSSRKVNFTDNCLYLKSWSMAIILRIIGCSRNCI